MYQYKIHEVSHIVSLHRLERLINIIESRGFVASKEKRTLHYDANDQKRKKYPCMLVS